MSKPVVTRLKVNGDTFEALCNPQKIKEFRGGKCRLDDALMDSDNVYKNASKGERWAAKDLEAAFGTKDTRQILERILTNGVAPQTTEETREDVVRKRREIIHYLSSKYIDPKSGRPHPATRIESALDSFKGLTIDPKRDAASQAGDLVRRIQDAGLPLKKLEMEGTVTVAVKHQKSALELLRKIATITGTTHKEGDVVISVALAPSDLETMQKQLSKLTAGEFVFDLPLPPVSHGQDKGGGKKGKKSKS